ncbi:uncharacterized protein LOC114716200 [Neltuma alba]|uniref:uncharacterized protein LOC114716200 n=1 Tax=Neltuma alba TaxID=207710 RepID=UPI0010A4F427|nr:uncharacterized protein LOC114716200 [Prosopis alba]
MMPSSGYPERLLLTPSDSNSGMTECTYFSHISSPVDPFTDCDSSLELSNINHVFDTNRNNMRLVNEQTWIQQGLTCPGVPESNCASVAFQNAVGGYILPEKGRFLRSVMDAGPPLQMLPVPGPLPTWSHPPPHNPQHFNFAPPLNIEDLDFAEMGNCAELQRNSFSDSVLDFAGVHSDPWIAGQVPGSKRQRLY